MRTDLKLVNNDLFIDKLQNDFVIDFSDEQHLYDIFYSFPGWWKEFKEVGIGLQSYINSSGKQQEINRNSRVQLEADGYAVTNLQINQQSNGTFLIITDATS